MADELKVPSEGRKSRKQSTYYPAAASTSNTKPYSKSAAKRSSVLALGSIEHLQYYFTKTGLAAKQKPGFKAKGLVPAIGGGHLRTPSAISGIPQIAFDLPPSPVVPPTIQHPFVDVVKDYEVDPEELLPGLVADLQRVSDLWHIGRPEEEVATPAPAKQDALRPTPTIASPGEFDVLLVLQATTNAIRSVRNYLVALPDETPILNTAPTFRPHTISHRPSPAKKPAQRPGNDPLSKIRREALDVLAALRGIEERYRLPMTDDSFEGASENGSGSTRSAPSPSGHHSGDDDSESTASFNFSMVTVPGRKKTVPVWPDEEEDVMNDDTEQERRENWDEKLVLGGGWLYRNDVSFSDVQQEKQVVVKYLNTVDAVLFPGDHQNGVRGWSKTLDKIQDERRGSSRNSSVNGRLTPERQPSPVAKLRAKRSGGLLTDTMQAMTLTEEPEDEPASPMDEEHLPNWAKRTAFVDDPMGRTFALLVHLLPVELLHLLPPPSETPSSEALMMSLCSGQLLCVAYNAGVRKSKKPWGYINANAVHDIAALEADAAKDGEGEGEKEKRRTAWTFRRTENLRLWAAALKMRYMIPLVSPANLTAGGSPRNGTPATSPSALTLSFGHNVTPFFFDAAIVAKKGPLWEEMLHDAVILWVNAVVAEKRGDS
ncbi:SubName: Full=Uncharacterized protein {ECO:0000313/EMBL:CCA69893.1} [Serendipita indica DSM 11827]|uniref:Uncharacterized protein n=1 Tax=Serendipita indica (strain DSM 11827) TaxID=1109443 RepID=G4TEY8_SERID|nr:SubName: Full=Uncharacterized protein {ECO:0000313/EMBL:CCA69893.1} [Serendipita indica DSM 11827]CCA69893.1 hypothetical protein PIIN_03832 [Serendipita indica DSM 11827]